MTRLIHVLCGILLLIGSLTSASAQDPSIRLSLNFILDASGYRPGTGSINTEAEIDNQIAAGNAIFSKIVSELRIVKVAVSDVVGHSEWYNTDTNNNTDRDAMRAAAMGNPDAFHWRTDAVNVYINGSTNTAISDFPPNNNIILLGQGIYATTLPHEIGHILNLIHTHEDDQCPDTIADNKDWSLDDISNNNFGHVYSALTAPQRYQVDLVWGNLMSYHDPDFRSILTPSQMDRQSAQAYANRNTLLTHIPVYVDSGYTGTHSGSFVQPYQTIQAAISAGGVQGKVMVLEQGAYARPGNAIGNQMSIVTRKGGSVIQERPAEYVLPYSVQQTTNQQVRKAVELALGCDRKGDVAGVITNLLEAEKLAESLEKTALQLEIAQRHRDARQFDDADKWFRKVAVATDQKKLKAQALKDAEDMRSRATAIRDGVQSARPARTAK